VSAPLVEAVIDLDALGANLAHLRTVVAPAQLMMVVKADAYGHGLVPTVRHAVGQGIRAVGALDLDTALTLRASGVGPETMILAWLYPPGQDFTDAIRARIDLSVSSVAELSAIAAAAERLAGEDGFVPPRLQLKLDTGLHRNGATVADWPQLVTAAVAAERRGLVRTFAAWTHIAEASDEEDTLSLRRLLDGVEAARRLGANIELRHLAASAAGQLRPDVRLDLVRMGGHCWGIPSPSDMTPAQLGIVPVMTLRARVLAVRDRGEGRAEAYVSAGYGDGIHRRAAGRVAVAIRGRRYPVLSVQRDHLVLETDGDPAVGDEAVLFGPGRHGEQTVREWADATDTLGEEYVTRVAARVPRRYVGGDTGAA
jgi:alanine racemase